MVADPSRTVPPSARRTLRRIAAVAGAALVAALLTAAVPTTATAAAIHVTDLGTLGGGVCCSAALDINEAGDIVGWSVTGGDESTPQHAVIWHNGHIRDLGTLGGRLSRAQAINKFNTVVGWSLTAGGDQHATMWRNGQVIDLGTLGGTTSNATDINNNGGVVGTATDAHGVTFGFIWRNGVMSKLATPPGTTLFPTAINDHGRIAATLDTDPNSPSHPARWDNGTAVALTTDPGVTFGLTEHGVITGSVTHDGVVQGFVFKGGVVVRLPLATGAAEGEVRDVTNNCHAVGTSLFINGTPFEPTHWPACGTAKILPGLSGGSDGTGQANAINETNQIVGFSSLAAGGGGFHAVLWTS